MCLLLLQFLEKEISFTLPNITFRLELKSHPEKVLWDDYHLLKDSFLEAIESYPELFVNRLALEYVEMLDNERVRLIKEMDL